MHWSRCHFFTASTKLLKVRLAFIHRRTDGHLAGHTLTCTTPVAGQISNHAWRGDRFTKSCQDFPACQPIRPPTEEHKIFTSALCRKKPASLFGWPLVLGIYVLRLAKAVVSSQHQSSFINKYPPVCEYSHPGCRQINTCCRRCTYN